MLDITALKQVDEALRLSESKYRLLVDEVNDGFYICDSHGVLTYANQALARILGFEKPEALIGQNFLQFVKPVQVGRDSRAVPHRYGDWNRLAGASRSKLSGRMAAPDSLK